jgi:hypothetical protein
MGEPKAGEEVELTDLSGIPSQRLPEKALDDFAQPPLRTSYWRKLL